jgi:hypothetical protein
MFKKSKKREEQTQQIKELEEKIRELKDWVTALSNDLFRVNRIVYFGRSEKDLINKYILSSSAKDYVENGRYKWSFVDIIESNGKKELVFEGKITSTVPEIQNKGNEINIRFNEVKDTKLIVIEADNEN